MKRFLYNLWRDFGGFWRVLAIAAIVFEAGISGSWLAEQMRNPLPYWWGFYGAVIQGLSTFGGVNLAQKGKRKGWAVVAVGGIAGVVFSSVFFGEVHHPAIAMVLGIFPTGIAVLAGVIESSQEQVNKQERLEEEEREFARLRILEQDKLKAQVRIETVKAAQLPPPVGYADGQGGQQNGHVRSVSANGRTEADKADFVRWLTANPSATGADVAAAYGVSERTGRRWIAEAQAKAAPQ